MIHWITSSLDWMPLVGGWAFFVKVIIVWMFLLTVMTLGFVVADYARKRRTKNIAASLGVAAITIGMMSLVPVSIAAVAAVIPPPPPPIPSSTAPIVGAEDMDRERIEIRGYEGQQRAVLVLYGEREDDSFRVEGYRVRVVGSSAFTNAVWGLSLPSSFRHVGYGIGPDRAIRSDGEWQWGRPNQEGVFSSGETYEFYFDFDTDARDGYAAFPISF